MSYLQTGGLQSANLAQLDHSKTREKEEAMEEVEEHHGFTGEKDLDAREEARRMSDVQGLAREMTRKSTFSEADLNPLEAGPESKLNPNSPNFSARAWARSLLHLREQDNARNPARTSGIAFRNLNVYGFGTASDYQKTVGNIFLKTVGVARKLMGVGQRRIDILQDFEGIVHSGEMLVVLGPPGSGCTTFLKTISGETFGFNVDKDSYLNYKGTSSSIIGDDRF
jgi:ATP-binding cassette subfamily G (WHITE) protein 2 (PDR)